MENMFSLAIEESDDVYADSKDYEFMYTLLVRYRFTNEVNVLWRLARATRGQGRNSYDIAITKTKIFEAFEYSQKALELDENIFACHLWYAVLLDDCKEYSGHAARFSVRHEVNEHLLKALELNPSDATTMFFLGKWCYYYADPSFVKTKLAEKSSDSKTATYEEALKYFQDAEEVAPGVSLCNAHMHGLTLLKLNERARAKDVFQKAMSCMVKTKEDDDDMKKIKDHLKSL